MTVGEGSDSPRSEDPSGAPLTRPGRPEEIDVDRGAAHGALVGVFMFVVFQAMIVGLFQAGIVSGETPLWAPLRFAGITQLIYVAPSLLFFVNRKCPQMAKGFTVVAGAVFLGGAVALIAG